MKAKLRGFLLCLLVPTLIILTLISADQESLNHYLQYFLETFGR